MEKLEKYKNAIVSFLEDWAELKPINLKNADNQVVIDKTEKHFMLVSLGWHGNRLIYEVLFHFDIINDKIYIQRNQTESQVADELIKLGVDRNDIVLGFHHINVRQHTGFAIS